jgi:hypothetical protein
METFLGVLASASFLEKASLLVLGAALTGIIVPVVKFPYVSGGRWRAMSYRSASRRWEGGPAKPEEQPHSPDFRYSYRCGPGQAVAVAGPAGCDHADLMAM